jgi:NAD(P)H dehydrogenase (quinone)
MADVRLAVIFYSTYGTNHAMAEVAADAARQAGADVRLLRVAETAPASVVAGQEKWKAQADRVAHIPEVSVADMEWANAYLISAPTRYGVSASQLRAFIDTLGPIWQQGKLANKAFSAMTSASNPHGGQETTLISLYTTAMHWGAVLVPPGYTDPAVFEAGGNPYGTTTVGVQDGVLPDGVQKAIAHQARRLVEIGRKLAG